MKSILITILTLTASITFAQNKYVDGTDEPQPTELKGKFIIDPYVGLPSSSWFQNKQLDAVKQNDTSFYAINSEVTGLPVLLGLKLEYMLSNNIGLGLDVNYQESGVKTTWKNGNNYYDPVTANYAYKDTSWNWNEKKLRIMWRFQAHFGTEKVDMYGGASIGAAIILNKKDASYTNNRPDPGDYPILFAPIKAVGYGLQNSGIPIAVRGYIGARFMVANNFGILTEIGLFSGSLLNVGATIRF